MFFTGFVK
jgi:hypothetical protein